MTDKTPITQEQVRAAQADPGAFEAIYLAYADGVYRYLLSRYGNPGLAEELTAQTFLAALESLPGYRHRGHFAAWLFTIARNKAADHFRQAEPQANLGQAESLAADMDLAGQAQESERLGLLRALIAELPEDERELLRLRYVAGLRFQAMGEVLGRNPDTVKKALYRLQDRLQGQLEEDHE